MGYISFQDLKGAFVSDSGNFSGIIKETLSAT